MPGDDRDSTRWKFKWQARAESVLATWESLAGRNELVADIMQFEPGEGFVVGRLDELVKAHPQNLRDVAEGWLAPSRARYVLIEPMRDVPALSRATYTGGAEAHATFVDATLPDRPLPTPRPTAGLKTNRFTTANHAAACKPFHKQLQTKE